MKFISVIQKSQKVEFKWLLKILQTSFHNYSSSIRQMNQNFDNYIIRQMYCKLNFFLKHVVISIDWLNNMLHRIILYSAFSSLGGFSTAMVVTLTNVVLFIIFWSDSLIRYKFSLIRGKLVTFRI